MAARETERGLDGLVQNAVNGLNAMPPRGGNPALTDAQIQAAVEFMLQQ
jgi:cytochrome c5